MATHLIRNQKNSGRPLRLSSHPHTSLLDDLATLGDAAQVNLTVLSE